MIIDGFDRVFEFSASPGPKLLIDFIRNLQQNNYEKLHLLVSSKQETDMCQALQDVGVTAPVSVEVGAQASPDLVTYVRYHMEYTIPKLPPLTELGVLSYGLK